MCEGAGVCEGAGQPVSVAGALGMLDRALGCLAAADTAGLPAAVQAEALLALEKAARHTAARARLLAAFAARAGTRTTDMAVPAPG